MGIVSNQYQHEDLAVQCHCVVCCYLRLRHVDNDSKDRRETQCLSPTMSTEAAPHLVSGPHHKRRGPKENRVNETTGYSDRTQVPFGRSHSPSSQSPTFQHSRAVDTSRRNMQKRLAKEVVEKNSSRRYRTRPHIMERGEDTGV